MTRKFIIALPVLFVIAIGGLAGCKKEETPVEHIPFVYTDSITDLEGNVYHTVQIGSQVWLAENLRSTRYNNGDTIVYEMYSSDWDNTLGGATCIYDNNAEAGSIYGNLYNFNAVADTRGLAPPGWHVATYYEWIALAAYCANNNAGNNLREYGGKHWLVDNSEGNDQYGFCALPGGYRDFQGLFYDVRNAAYFWSSTHWLPSIPGYPEAWYMKIVGDKDPTLGEPEHEIGHLSYDHGCYVRCVKD